MSALASHVTGERFGGLGVCHGPGCGAAMPPEAVGYCSKRCRDEARRLALAGIAWSPAPEFIDVVRHRANAEKSPGVGTSLRTRQRRAKKAMSTT